MSINILAAPISNIYALVCLRMKARACVLVLTLAGKKLRTHLLKLNFGSDSNPSKQLDSHTGKHPPQLFDCKQTNNETAFEVGVFLAGPLTQKLQPILLALDPHIYWYLYFTQSCTGSASKNTLHSSWATVPKSPCLSGQNSTAANRRSPKLCPAQLALLPLAASSPVATPA